MNTFDAPPPNPFPGLRPFRGDENHLFFGREDQTVALLRLLRTKRFLAVVGTSGSGKSSLVRAGMIAGLHGGAMSRAGSTWEVLILRPGGSPVENLVRALVEAGLYDADDAEAPPRLLATLNRSRFGLVEAIKQSDVLEPGANVLVVVDQFEELFRFRRQGVESEETAAAFVNLLLTAADQAECPIYATITMRSDYLGDCSEIPGLAEAVNEGEYLIPRLSRDQKRDAIEKPIGVGGGAISPLLVQRLLNDVGDDPDQLPVLQHALMRMWDAWSAGDERDRPIDFADFEATGGLGEALSNHADEIYDALPDDRHRTVCERIFKTLTEKGQDNRGIRRPTRLPRLEAIADSDRALATTVLDAFRAPGVTFLMPGVEVGLGDRTVIDLSHESLMRGWARLRVWVEDEAQSARIFRRLLDTARLWGEGKAGLFRDPDLQIALSWRDAEAPNAEWAEQYGGDFETAVGFLETSGAAAEADRRAGDAARRRELEQARELAEAQRLRLEHQRRSARSMRGVIAGLAVVAVVAIAACVAALFANQRANTLADNARRSATRAELSQIETAKALAVVATQKTEVEQSLSKAETAVSQAETAERTARAAQEAGRKLLYTTDMSLAPFVWSDDRSTPEKLRVLLAKHIPDAKAVPPAPDLRGFEWRYYQHLLDDGAAVFRGHDAPVVAAAFAPDGRLATLDQNGQIRRWDLDSQAEDPTSRRDLPGAAGAQRIVLAPDGRRAALAQGKQVHVFDALTGKQMFQIESANDEFRRLVFSRRGDVLVVVDDKIRWFNAATGAVIAAHDQKYDRVASLALSADGLTLAVVGHGDTQSSISSFRLDATTRMVTQLARGFGFGSTLAASAMSPDGRLIAVGLRLGGTLMLLKSVNAGQMTVWFLTAHASPITAMAVSGDGARLATADAAGTIKIWADLPKLNSKSEALVTLKGRQGPITSLGFSDDAKRLVSTSDDKTASVWDLEHAGASIRPLERGSQTFEARFSPDGRLIASADPQEGGVRLWDAASGRLVRQLPAGGKGGVFSVAFSPTDGRLMAVGYGGAADVSHVALWDIDTGRELARLPGATDLLGFPLSPQNGAVGALAFSPDGKYLVAGFGARNNFDRAGLSTPLKVWEVASRRLIRRLYGHTGFCVSLDFSKDGTLMASGGRDGKAILWSTATWKKTRILLNPEKDSIYGGAGMIEGVSFSPDGKTLALASREGTVQLWDVAAGKLLESLKGHSSAVQVAAFAPDGRTLASGGADQTIRLWTVETRRELMRLDPGGLNLDVVMTLAFSPDGNHLLAGGYGGAAFWSAAPNVWNDPDRAAETLRLILLSKADFQSRVRMLSENLRLREALARLKSSDPRVQAALAAAGANWRGSRGEWPEAVADYDRLAALDPTAPGAWLRTPGLLRLATALVHRNRPVDAARLLQGGAERRAQDALPAVTNDVGTGFTYSTEDGAVRVTELVPESPGSRGGLLVGDVLVKVGDVALTPATSSGLREMLKGDAGTKVRLTVRRSGSDQPVVIESTRARFVNDPATGELLRPLRAAVDERLAKDPRDPGLLELRGELAGQWSDFAAQAADYTAAIEILSKQPTAAADLKRLFARRGNAYLGLKRWNNAVDDYARVVTDATTDDALLTNQARALAESLGVVKTLAPTAETEATLWRYTTDKPADDWAEPDFKDAGWKEGAAPFGTADVSQARTAWNTPDIWLRRRFEVANAKELQSLRARVLCDDDAQVYLNGKPAGRRDSLTGGNYLVLDLDPQARHRIAPGVNTIAVHCRNTGEAGSVDVGLDSAPAGWTAIEERLAAVGPWQKLAAAYRFKGDQKAIDRLVERRPQSAGLVGDVFAEGIAGDKDWARAIALYDKGLTAGKTDPDLFAKRGRAHEALKNWTAAAADWERAAAGNPDGANLRAEFARRLAAAETPKRHAMRS